MSFLETVPILTFVRAESLRSTTLFHDIVDGSMFSGFFLLKVGWNI